MEFNFDLPGLNRNVVSRPERVAEAIKKELSLVLLEKIRDPRLSLVTIVEVKMTPDLKRANIHFDVSGENANPGEAVKAFAKAKGFMRSQLAARLNMRHTPELSFRHSKRGKDLDRLDAIFRQIASEKNPDDE